MLQVLECTRGCVAMAANDSLVELESCADECVSRAELLVYSLSVLLVVLLQHFTMKNRRFPYPLQPN